jgi:FixJ family two-component response regulator
MIRSQSVFVVDEDSSVRNGLTRLLGAAGFEVVNFATVVEFIDSLDGETNGCLVLDATVTRSTNEAQMESFTDPKNRKPIIVISANGNSESRQLARNLRAVAFFRKPVDGTALFDAIRWAMG